MREKQTTIKQPFSLAGKGLHTGLMVRATIKPAPAHSGITLLLTDIKPNVSMPALSVYGGDCARGTVLVKDGARVTTLEHLMAAFHGLHIDNAVVELNGPEVPILDGSALPWVEAILKAGVQELDAEREYIQFSEPILADYGNGTTYRVDPADDFQIHCHIDFGNTVIGCQDAELTNYGQFQEQIAPCRTFCFLHEVEAMLKASLIKGGDLDNALVYVNGELSKETQRSLAIIYNKNIDEIKVTNGVINTVSQYFPNEPARHKLLDFMGDILLLGRPVKGHFNITCPGHKHNIAFANHLLETLK